MTSSRGSMETCLCLRMRVSWKRKMSMVGSRQIRHGGGFPLKGFGLHREICMYEEKNVILRLIIGLKVGFSIS